MEPAQPPSSSEPSAEERACAPYSGQPGRLPSSEQPRPVPILRAAGGGAEAAAKGGGGIVWDEENLQYNEEHKTATMTIDEPDTPYNFAYSADDDELPPELDIGARPEAAQESLPSPRSDDGGAEDAAQRMAELAGAVGAAMEESRGSILQLNPPAEGGGGGEEEAPEDGEAPPEEAAPRRTVRSVGGIAVESEWESSDDDEIETPRQREERARRKRQFELSRKQHYASMHGGGAEGGGAAMSEGERMRAMRAKLAAGETSDDSDDER